MGWTSWRLWQSGKRRRRALLCAGTAVVAWPVLAYFAAQALIVNAELPRADALVVLSGSATYVERARRAAELFHEGRAPKIIVTNDGVRGGWSQAQQRNVSFTERTLMELRDAGVPDASVEVLPQLVSSTYDEARFVRERANTQGLGSLLLVTSGYHSRRALRTFRGVFTDSSIHVGIAPVAPGQQTPTPATWWLRRRGWQLVAGEYAKSVYYLFRYG